MRAEHSGCKRKKPTAPAEEIGEDIKGILLGLSTLVGLQSLFSISVIYLAFLTKYEDRTRGMMNGSVL